MNKKIIALLGVSLVTCLAALAYTYQGQGNLTRAHGNVDIRQSSLSFERSGKIRQLFVDEGQKVKQGQILATLDTQDLDHQIKIKLQQCKKSQAALDEMTTGYRQEDINQAKASVDRLENSYKLAVLTYERFQKLFKTKSTSEQQRDDTFFKMEETKGLLNEAKAKYKLLTSGNREEDVLKAQADHDSCKAQLEYLNYQKNGQSVIKAPYDGLIRTRKNEVGDMTSPSSSVFEISVIDKKRVRVYATQVQLQNIKLGSKVSVDDSLGNSIEGQVGYISNTAMFTPKTVQTEDLRADLVYEIRVDVVDKDNVLRLGQPVSVSFE